MAAEEYMLLLREHRGLYTRPLGSLLDGTEKLPRGLDVTGEYVRGLQRAVALQTCYDGSPKYLARMDELMEQYRDALMAPQPEGPKRVRREEKRAAAKKEGR